LKIIVCGDIAQKHGLIKPLCGLCHKPVRKNQRAIQCEFDVNKEDYDEKNVDCNYIPCHSESTSASADVNSTICRENVFEDLTMRCNPSNLVCGYLNINGLRYKYEHIKDLLQRNLFDVIFRSEAKIDPFFPNAQLDFC
jgi:hypothetical protein